MARVGSTYPSFSINTACEFEQAYAYSQRLWIRKTDISPYRSSTPVSSVAGAATSPGKCIQAEAAELVSLERVSTGYMDLIIAKQILTYTAARGSQPRRRHRANSLPLHILWCILPSISVPELSRYAEAASVVISDASQYMTLRKNSSLLTSLTFFLFLLTSFCLCVALIVTHWTLSTSRRFHYTHSETHTRRSSASLRNGGTLEYIQTAEPR